MLLLCILTTHDLLEQETAMNLRFIVLSAAILCCAIPASALEIKDVTFTTANAGKVVFSHSAHLKKKNRTAANVSCKACHNDNMIKNTHYTMAEMEQGKSCGMCHNGNKAFALAKCATCHKVSDITFKVKETGPVLFRHSIHLVKKPDCGSCHNAIFKTSSNPRVSMAEMAKGKSCGACHNGKAAFSLSSCTKCHPVKEITFVVKDAGHVTFSHSSHIRLYNCGECHTAFYDTSRSKKHIGMKEMEKGKSCGTCHDGKTAFTVKENCATCHKM